MKVYCDSSAKEACYVIEGESPCIVPYLEPVTVNEGEYMAVICALKACLDQEIKNVELLTDSQLIANQVNGKWECRKEHLAKLRNQARSLMYSAPRDRSRATRTVCLHSA